MRLVGLISFFMPLYLTCHPVDLYEGLHLDKAELARILDFVAHEEETCAWVAEYGILAELINQMGLQKGCELGVAYGGQSRYLLEHTGVARVYSVDPYHHFPASEWNDGGNFNQNTLDVMFLKVAHMLRTFGPRSHLIRDTSSNAASLFQNEELDFVYIDANHEYSHVLQDLSLWYPKVRSGGLVAGDDYIVWGQSVPQAVYRFTKQHGIVYQTRGNKWWFIKP